MSQNLRRRICRSLSRQAIEKGVRGIRLSLFVALSSHVFHSRIFVVGFVGRLAGFCCNLCWRLIPTSAPTIILLKILDQGILWSSQHVPIPGVVTSFHTFRSTFRELLWRRLWNWPTSSCQKGLQSLRAMAGSNWVAACCSWGSDRCKVMVFLGETLVWRSGWWLGLIVNPQTGRRFQLANICWRGHSPGPAYISAMSMTDLWDL
jgi:hypothetical protein